MEAMKSMTTPPLDHIGHGNIKTPNSNDIEAAAFAHDLLDISGSEHESFIYLARFVVNNVTKHKSLCEQCKAPTVPDKARVLEKLKSYADNCQRISPAVCCSFA